MEEVTTGTVTAPAPPDAAHAAALREARVRGRHTADCALGRLACHLDADYSFRKMRPLAALGPYATRAPASSSEAPASLGPGTAGPVFYPRFASPWGTDPRDAEAALTSDALGGRSEARGRSTVDWTPARELRAARVEETAERARMAAAAAVRDAHAAALAAAAADDADLARRLQLSGDGAAAAAAMAAALRDTAAR